MNIQTITLDISKRSAVTPVLYLRQGDKSGTQLRVNVMRDGAAFPLGGYGVRFEMRAPKDRGYYECTGSANGNVATFTIDETYAAAFPGVTDVAYVRILEGSTVIASTGNFRVVIHEDGTEGADPNGAYTNGVTEWLEDATEQLNDVSGRAEAAIEAIGDISELAVPLMSTDVRGGAKLGHGLRISAERLGVQLVDGASGEASVGADGDYLHALAVHGKSVQDGTPTPDNPIEVRTVKGINLFDGAIESGVYNNTNGEKVSSGNYARNANRIPVAGGATYTINMKRAYSNSGLYLYTFGADGAYIGTMPGSLTLPYTFTVAQSVAYICFGIGGSSTVEAPSTISEVQLELGTKAGPYIPYGALGLKVTGKNRLDFTKTPYTQYVSYRIDGDSITVTSNNASNWSYIRYDLAISPGSYTLSYEATSGFRVGIEWYNGSTRVGFAADQSNKLIVATVPSGCDSLRVIFYARGTAAGSVGDTCTYSNIQLEADSAPTEYAPFLDSVTPVPLNGNVLASLPDGTHDELTVDDAGHAVLTKNMGMVTFDGTENWIFTESTAIAYASPNAKWSDALNARNVANVWSNRFVGAENNQKAGLIRFDRLYPNISFVIGTFSSAAEVKAWLAENLTTMHYPLATPQTIDLGYIDMPKLSEGSTIELLATIDPPIDAEWWAVGAGAVHEAVAAQSERIAALESAIAELATS